MLALNIIFVILLTLIVSVVISLTIVCYRVTFYNNRKVKSTEEYPTPEGEIYDPYREQMISWMKETRNLSHKDVTTTSFDGLKLCGKYYEYEKGAPVELMFHGYRGTGERDLCGGVQRCFRLKRNVLLVDQRASGKSEGKTITFGINESRDVLSWIDFIIAQNGKDTKIILTGISMGGATVLTAAGRDLPENVVCILADCSYSTPKEIIQKVTAESGLPPKLVYPFMKLAARVFGHFRLSETSPLEAMKRCKVPIIFIHGEDDAFVPCDMSRKVFDACNSKKLLYTVPKAGHGLSYLVDTEGYFKALTTFCTANNI